VAGAGAQELLIMKIKTKLKPIIALLSRREKKVCIIRLHPNY
jgi:hypothetical protein